MLKAEQLRKLEKIYINVATGLWQDEMHQVTKSISLLVTPQKAFPLPLSNKEKWKHTFLCTKDDHFPSLAEKLVGKKNPNILSKTIKKYLKEQSQLQLPKNTKIHRNQGFLKQNPKAFSVCISKKQ